MDSFGAVLLLSALLLLGSVILAGLAIGLDPRSGERAWQQKRAERPRFMRAA